MHSPRSPKSEWERAKALVEMEQTGICQAIGHLYECHIRMEIICNAQPKHMSLTHPLYEIMRQHCMGTESLGYFGADRTLLSKGGFFDSLFEFGRVGALQMMNKVFDNDHYDNMDMELRLKVFILNVSAYLSHLFISDKFSKGTTTKVHSISPDDSSNETYYHSDSTSRCINLYLSHHYIRCLNFSPKISYLKLVGGAHNIF